MVCEKCQLDNPADSKFCRECGARLPEPKQAVKAIKPEEIDGLLAQGYALHHEGNQDEPLFIAESVLAIDPENSSALALKGMVHEAKGELEQAAAVYEQIVLINPDSTLDRVKLEQIRRKLPDPGPELDETEQRSRRTVAIFSAVAAGVLVMATGLMIAMFSRQARAENPESPNYAASQAVGFDLTPKPQPTAQKPQQPVQQNPSSGLPRADEPFRPPHYVRDQNNNWVVQPVQPSGTEALPDTNANAGSAAAGTQNPNTTNGTAASNPAAGPEPSDERPANRGKIDIRPSSGSGQDSGAVSENTYRVAQQKMQAGDYRGAVRDFESSLEGSKQPALTHQLIARCQKRLGETDSAKSHLRTAIDLFEKSGNKAGADSCRRELQAMGG